MKNRLRPVMAALAAFLVSAAFADATFDGARLYSFMTTGTSKTGGQRINTGYRPNGQTIIRAKYSLDAVAAGDAANQCLYCARTSTSRSASDPDFSFFATVGVTPRFDYYDNTYAGKTTMVRGTVYLLEVKDGRATLTDEAGDPVETLARPAGVATFTSNHELFLFSSYSHDVAKNVYSSFNNGSRMKFYYLRVYEVEGGEEVLKHEYVPCLTDANVVAVADTVTETVLYNGVSPNTFSLAGATVLEPAVTVRAPSVAWSAEGSCRVEGTMKGAGSVRLVLSAEGLADKVFDLGTFSDGETIGKTIVASDEGLSSDVAYTAAFEIPSKDVEVAVPEALYFGSRASVTRYVATDGSNDNDGLTADTPMASIQKAADSLTLAAQGVVGTVRLAAGTYAISAPIVLTNAVRLVGAGTDDATGTVLRNVGTYTYDRAFRLLTMANALAAASDLVVTGGNIGIGGGDNGGGAINISAGTVSNCVIRNSYAKQASTSHPHGGGVFVHGDAALVTHCLVSNCTIVADAAWIGDDCGAGIQISAGKVSNTLVCNCRTDASSPTAAIVTGGIFASGGTVENCTVIGCKGSAHGGVHASSSGATVVNTVSVGNVKRIKSGEETVETVSGLTGKASAFDTCVSDDEAAVNDTCRTATIGAFNDFEHGDLVPAIGGALYNAGKAVDNPPALDLMGANRVVGASIDIGCFEQNASSTCVIVGDPASYGEPSVAWGTHTDLSGRVTVTIQDRYDDPNGGMYAVTDGWTLYVQNGDVWAVSQGGTGTSATFDVPETPSRLVWNFTRYYRMTLGTVGSGTATGDEWVREGATFTPVVTPSAGWHFVGWAKDAGEDERLAASFVIEKALALDALFLPTGLDCPVVHVAKGGDDANDGFARDAPKASVKNAVEFVSRYEWLGGEVRVAAGLYYEMQAVNTGLTLAYPIRVVGETGNPDDVILNYAGFPGNYFILNDPDAALCNLTVTNANATGQISGVGVRVNSHGGMVSNCVVTCCGGSGYQMKGGGVALFSVNALVTHTKVVNCKVGDENRWGGAKGAGIHLEPGRAEDCLVVGCYTQTAVPAENGYPVSVGGIYVSSGAKALNCTVVNCRGTKSGGIWAVSGAQVANCAIIDGGYPGEKPTGAGEVDWAGYAASFSHCATDGEAAINDTCLAGLAADAFRGFDKGDFRPAAGGVLCDAGTSEGLSLSPLDLAGKTRIQHKVVDIGCYETDAAGLRLILR